MLSGLLKPHNHPSLIPLISENQPFPAYSLLSFRECSIDTTPLSRYQQTRASIRTPASREWLEECFLNRITRKVNKDSTVSIDKVSYDVPMQFISSKVEIRFLPDDMSSAFILYEGVHYPIRPTDKNENCRTKRNNTPGIDYSKLGGGC